MSPRISVIAAALVGLAVGSVATAAGDWKVMKTATAKGDVVTHVTASANAREPTALAIRASGAANFVEWSLSCTGIMKSSTLAGKVLPLSVQSANGCSVFVTSTGGAGTLRLQLLRR